MFPTFEAGRAAETVGQRRVRGAEKRAASRASISTASSAGSSNTIDQSIAASASATSQIRSANSTKSKSSNKSNKSSGGFFFKRRSRDVIEIVETPKQAPVEADVQLPIQQQPTQPYDEVSSPSISSPSHPSHSTMSPISPMSPVFKANCSEPLPPPTPPPLQSPPPLPKDAHYSVFPRPVRESSLFRRPANHIKNQRDDRAMTAAAPPSLDTIESEPTGRTTHMVSATKSDLVVSMTDLGIHETPAHQRSNSRSRHDVSTTEGLAGRRPQPVKTPAVVKSAQGRAPSKGTRGREDHVQPSVPKTAFGRLLGKMEKAGLQIVATRLNEEWDEESDDESNQEMAFEKKLWALTAYEWLTQGKQLQSPTHELLSGSLMHEGRRVLHMHGSIADGWVLAARYPGVSVFTVSSQNGSSPMACPAPSNHHSLYLPSSATAATTMPFPDCYFDAVVSRSLPSTLSHPERAPAFLECMRVLKPGARMEIHALDPYMAAQGPLLRRWVDSQVVGQLEARAKPAVPSNAVIEAMGAAGLRNVVRARIALPAALPEVASTENKLLTYLGRYLYQERYAGVVGFSGEGGWFWEYERLEGECRAFQTHMVLTIACAQKPEG